MISEKYIELGKQFIRFSIIGVINAIVDFSVLNLLIRVVLWPILAANTISFSSAVVFSYFLNKYWTFRDYKPLHMKQFPLFVVISLVGLGLSDVLMHFGTSLLLGNPYLDLSFVWSYNLAKVVSAGIVLLWNFVAYKIIVFKK